MAIYIFRQGETQKIIKIITEIPAVDFSTATEIFCILSIGGIVQQRYSLNTRQDYGKIEVGSSNEIINILVERNESINFSEGVLNGYLIGEWINTDFPSGKETKSWKFILGKVIEGEGLDIII
jgi:hypothetical protein